VFLPAHDLLDHDSTLNAHIGVRGGPCIGPLSGANITPRAGKWLGSAGRVRGEAMALRVGSVTGEIESIYTFLPARVREQTVPKLSRYLRSR